MLLLLSFELYVLVLVCIFFSSLKCCVGAGAESRLVHHPLPRYPEPCTELVPGFCASLPSLGFSR